MHTSCVYTRTHSHTPIHSQLHTPTHLHTSTHPHRELSAKKQEAQALVSEMECTAQAFEEMQEQNIRLLQQLKVVGRGGSEGERRTGG